MTIKKHMCIDVDAMLQNPERLINSIIVDGKPLDDFEGVRSFLLAAKAEGTKRITLGDCNNYDNEHGCLGHIVND